MDWIAFDLEHSMMFAFGKNGTLLTYIATRDLQLVYFDGCSGNKYGGVGDTQDILISGEPGRTGKPGSPWRHELDRIVDGCAWAKQYGIDGFLRMEFDFEVMYCDFSQSLELVSAMSSVNLLANWEPPSPSAAASHESRSEDDHSALPWQDRLPHGECTPEATIHGLTNDQLDKENGLLRDQSADVPHSYPKGWKGALPDLDIEAFNAGTWHNQFPGEVRVRVDPASMISFYDPALTSLVEARRTMTRDEYRPGNISQADIARVRADIAEVMTRNSSATSGVDWEALARVIQDRFADRLPYMRHLLHQPVTNVTERLARVRRQLIVSLIPYMHREDIGEPAWFARIARDCAARFTEHLPQAEFTKQERVLHHAVEEVLHEICRVYTEAWVDAFDAEGKSADVVRGYLERWRGEFDSLVDWLDWPVWIRCEPACGVDEICWVPQGAPWTPDGGHEPRCIPIDFDGFPPPV